MGASFRRAMRTPLGIATTVMLLLLLLTVLFSPVLFNYSATRIDVVNMEQGVSSMHLFGTDKLGRDIFSRVLVASRISVELALLTTVLAAVLGIFLGALPVVVPRRLGRTIVWTINLTLAFPGLLLALFLSMIFGVGARGAVLALAFALAPGFARLTYTTSSAIANADYVSAARLLGAPRRRIVLRHVLPNIAEPLVVTTTSVVGSALVALSALSYLGFGVQGDGYDWGRMLNEGLADIYTNPAAALAPGVAIMIAGVSFVLAGEFTAQLLANRHIGEGSFKTVGMPEPSVDTAGADPVSGTRPDAVDGPNGRPNAASAGFDSTVDAGLVAVAQNLTVSFPGSSGPLRAVSNVRLVVADGEIVGLVGESGSGKSVTASAMASLVPYPGAVSAAVLTVNGLDLLAKRSRLFNHKLGVAVATVFQDAMTSLNPAVRVGRQLAEVATAHQGMSRKAALAKAVDRLGAVRIDSPERRAQQYASEFSGGMRQRAMIGMGLMADPALIVADEPTTALDVTVQRDVLALFREASSLRGSAILFISHDIAVISELATRVLVMYAGRIVEELPVADLASDAAHPYTRALVASVPDMGTDRALPLATIPGLPPRPGQVAAGCTFADRCSLADATCRSVEPALLSIGLGRRVACWKPQSGEQESVATTPSTASERRQVSP